MKLVAINGSHRGTRGYTHFLIEKLFKGAREEGATCEEMTLAELKINRKRAVFPSHQQRHLFKTLCNINLSR